MRVSVQEAGQLRVPRSELLRLSQLNGALGPSCTVAELQTVPRGKPPAPGIQDQVQAVLQAEPREWGLPSVLRWPGSAYEPLFCTRNLLHAHPAVKFRDQCPVP